MYWPQWCSLHGHLLQVLQVCALCGLYVSSCCSWALTTVACQWKGLTLGWFVVRIGLDYSGEAVVQGLIPWSRILFRRALLPALCMCHLWMWLGNSLARSKARYCPGSPAISQKQSEDGCHPCWDWRCLEKQNSEHRPAAASARVVAAWQVVWDTSKLDTTC